MWARQLRRRRSARPQLVEAWYCGRAERGHDSHVLFKSHSLRCSDHAEVNNTAIGSRISVLDLVGAELLTLTVASPAIAQDMPGSVTLLHFISGDTVNRGEHMHPDAAVASH